MAIIAYFNIIHKQIHLPISSLPVVVDGSVDFLLSDFLPQVTISTRRIKTERHLFLIRIHAVNRQFTAIRRAADGHVPGAVPE